MHVSLSIYFELTIAFFKFYVSEILSFWRLFCLLLDLVHEVISDLYAFLNLCELMRLDSSAGFSAPGTERETAVG